MLCHCSGTLACADAAHVQGRAGFARPFAVATLAVWHRICLLKARPLLQRCGGRFRSWQRIWAEQMKTREMRKNAEECAECR
eukprot:scaffold685_cov281-Pinguiococcus_pyrenoidosus.AAC.20